MDGPAIKRGVVWTATDVVVRQVGQFAITIVLARLLAPSDFGLIALLSLFTAIASTFVSAGLGTALIRSRDVSHYDESTVFWFNQVIGSIVALLFGFGGPWIAGFYNEPRLVALSWAMGLNVWLAAWIAVPNALLTKKLDFRTQMAAAMAGIAAGGAVAIWLALRGAGVWALAAQALTGSFVTSVTTWMLFRWRPLLAFRWHSFRNLAGFGVYMLLSGLLDGFGSRLYTVLIGKFYSPTALGFYGRAAQTSDIPQITLASILSRVTLPAFSASAHDPVLLRHQVQRTVRGAMALSIPLMLGLAATAPDAMSIVFGSRWLPAAPFLQIIALGGIIYPLHIVNLNILVAYGHSHLFFRLDVIKQLVLIVAVSVASAFGISAIAWATVFCSIIALVINCWYTRRLIDYGLIAQIRDVAPYLAIGIMMGVVVFATRIWLTEFSVESRLLLEIVTGAAFYLGALWIFKLEALFTFHALVRYIMMNIRIRIG